VNSVEQRPTLKERVASYRTAVRRVNLHPIRDIWASRDDEDHGPVVKFLLTIVLSIRSLSPVYLGALLNRNGIVTKAFVDWYVAVWAIGLATFLITWSVSAPMVRAFAVGSATYRILDILSYQLAIVLVTRHHLAWAPAAVTRTILLSLVNIGEIVTCYAILYLGLGRIIESTPSGTQVTTPIRAFYYSLVTMATLGYGEFIPGDDRSRLIVILQMLTQIILVLTIVPLFVAHMVDDRDRRRHSD
jgi:hypothetical protein